MTHCLDSDKVTVMLELSSNTIKVLGIFGRLSPELEATLDAIEDNYSDKPQTTEYDIFRHLTLTFVNDATVADVHEQLQLLKELKQFLLLKITPTKAFVKDEESLSGAEHVAFEFELDQTKELVDFIKSKVGQDKAVATWYIKLVWFVSKENQQTAIDELSKITELEFTDFYLVANKQDEANTLFKASDF